MLNNLLDYNESYNFEQGKKLVKRIDKLNEVYDFLFSHNQNNEENKKIGQYYFDKRHREFVFEIVSLLSFYSEYEE